MSPAYVKPFVKRQKNDAADAEAICEAAQRPSMRFVAVKDEEQQANGVVFRARDVLVRQRTQCINALRGHLTEYGWVVPKGTTHMATLIEQIEDPKCALPERGGRLGRDTVSGSLSGASAGWVHRMPVPGPRSGAGGEIHAASRSRR